ncbi:MAG TPA: phage terminase large subunit [Kofleriaceae bacterium]
MTRLHVHRYAPRGTALELMRDRSPEILMSGPAGTGKSRACLEKLHALALKYPNFRGLIMRKTLASLGASALQTWRKYVIPEALAAGVVWYYGGSSEEPPQYRYKNGSAIMIGGMDKPTRIMSTEYDVIFAQEAIEFTEEDIESANSRLRNGAMPYQQLIMDTNPSHPLHWLKQRCDRKQTVIYFSTHEENPVYFDVSTDERGETIYTVTEAGAAYIAKLDALTGVRYHRLRRGLWVAAEGVIYEEWNESIHVIDRYEIPWEWPRFWAVDFGFVNPTVIGMFAEKPNGQLVLYREVYHTRKTVDEIARLALDAVSDPDPEWVAPTGRSISAHEGRIWREPRPRAIVCDHDAEGRATLARELDIPTRAADKRVKLGIDQVMIRMRPAERWAGQPGIQIMRDTLAHRRDPLLVDAKLPTCTAAEVPAYVWDIRDDGTSKDEPVKKDDHGCDMLRYLIVYRDPIRRASMRST